jgi:chromate transporter
MSDTAPAAPSAAEAFKYWLKLGFISFGGPAGQIGMMHQELVEKRRWISEHRFLHALNYCMLLPGPEAIQLATYIGWILHGVRGGILAGVLFFLPSLALLTALSWVYLTFGSVPAVAGILWGIKPAVVAVVLFAAWRIGSRALKSRLLWAFATLAFIAIFVFDVGFPWIVAVAALAGAIGGKLAPGRFRVGGGHGAADKDYGAAVIDDHTPTPAHARFSWPKTIVTGLAFVALWAAAMFCLAGTLRDMGAFFTEAAFLTFGGAYAVLPYVYQGGVEHYGWLSGQQMIDGLALGETTPGPLIMVVAFVGYLGGATKQILGPDNLFAAGAAGALVATYFTFLPSFLFILLGGPLVEATRGDLKFTAPLTGVTAAVVGVVVNLAVFFAWHTFWPQGIRAAPFAGSFEAVSVLIAVASFIALWRYKVDIMKLIGVCALIGLGRAALV